MNSFTLALVTLAVFISTANSLHLAAGTRSIDDSQDVSNVTTSVKSIGGGGGGSTSVKGNIGSITSIISNPTQIINQIQSTVNTLLQTLNNTLSGSTSNVTSLLTSIKNITSKSESLRLEDTDLLVANISEIVKNSARSEADILSNSTAQFNNEVNGAFEDFRKTIQQLKSSFHEHFQQDESSQGSAVQERNSGNENGADAANSEPVASEKVNESSKGRSMERRPNGLPKTVFDQLSSLRSQVDSRIQRSLTVARSAVEESLDLARQSSQNVQNQTAGFMGEIRRVFNEMSAPIRNFFETLRRGRPTAVVTA